MRAKKKSALLQQFKPWKAKLPEIKAVNEGYLHSCIASFVDDYTFPSLVDIMV